MKFFFGNSHRINKESESSDYRFFADNCGVLNSYHVIGPKIGTNIAEFKMLIKSDLKIGLCHHIDYLVIIIS